MTFSPPPDAHWRQHDMLVHDILPSSKLYCNNIFSGLAIEAVTPLARQWRNVGALGYSYSDLEQVTGSDAHVNYAAKRVSDRTDVFLSKFNWTNPTAGSDETNVEDVAIDYVTNLLRVAERVHDKFVCGVPDVPCYVDHFIAKIDGVAHPFVATKYHAGVRLGTFIDRSLEARAEPPAPPAMASIMKTLTAALANLHSLDIVLRSIEPRNVLIVNAFTDFTPYGMLIELGDAACWSEDSCVRKANRRHDLNFGGGAERTPDQLRKSRRLAPGDPQQGVERGEMRSVEFTLASLKAADVYYLGVLFFMLANNFRIPFVEPRLVDARIYSQNLVLSTIIQSMLDVTPDNRPTARQAEQKIGAWLSEHATETRKRHEPEEGYDVGKLKKQKERHGSKEMRRLHSFVGALRRLANLQPLTDTITVDGRERVFTLEFLHFLQKSDVDSEDAVDDFVLVGNMHLEEVREIPLFTIRVVLSTDNLDAVLDLFVNNLRYDPPKFKLVPLSKWGFREPALTLALVARKFAGIGRQLLCRVFREMLNAGIPADTQVTANAEPLVESTSNLTPDEEMDNLLHMYESLSFHPTLPRIPGKGPKHFLTEIQTTLGSVVRACEENPRTARGTAFNRA